MSKKGAEELGVLDDVVVEARERFKRCQEFESSSRERFLKDLRFAHGDAYNGYQWPENYRLDRQTNDRPCLTINKTRQHNLLIKNDAKENKPSITFRPVGNGATYESAQVWNGLARKIENQSNAGAVYDHATGFQVDGGFGYWRVITDYVADDSFDQDAFIKIVPDPLSVYIDPDAKEPDKSDAKFAFIYDDMLKSEAKAKYGPDIPLVSVTLDNGQGWIDSDKVRVCEYYRVVVEEDELWRFVGEDGQPLTLHRSNIEEGLRKEVGELPTTVKRKVRRKKVEWKFIIGHKVVEEKLWIGTTIPIVPLYGEEIIIDGQYDRKGHTRALLDPQRMYNYWSSSAVEFGALQTKTPWVASAEAIEGYENEWEHANTENKAVLRYNAFADGQAVPPPQRVQPPVSAPVALEGMQTASMEMMMVSGQYQNQMGQQGNERTGKAIAERQRQGDKATYHYIDNLGVAIRRTGMILKEILPVLYDTERVIQAIGEDGVPFEVKIDPQAAQIYQQEQGENQEVVARVLNPKLGQFDVYADVGPGYATRREEAFNAYTLIMTQAPQMAAILGDLLFRASDFPFADEAAARFRRMLPAQALGQGPTQAEQQLQLQLQQLQQLYAKLMDQSTMDKIRLKGHAEKRDVDIFNAITKRIGVLLQGQKGQGGESAVPTEAIRELVRDVLAETRHDSLQDDGQVVGNELRGIDPSLGAGGPPVPGAKKAQDGQWYVGDPLRPGKWLRVHHTPQQVQEGFLAANSMGGGENGQQ